MSINIAKHTEPIPIDKRLILTLLTLLLCTRPVNATLKVPYATKEMKECMTDCIDEGYVFCPKPPYIFGVCCELSKCGDTSNCSSINPSIGAKYLTCIPKDFCGEKVHTVSVEKQNFVMSDPRVSPGEACIY